jgi:hypothetical protein
VYELHLRKIEGALISFGCDNTIKMPFIDQSLTPDGCDYYGLIVPWVFCLLLQETPYIFDNVLLCLQEVLQAEYVAERGLELWHLLKKLIQKGSG